jgi:hypothetical protein
MGSMVLAPRPRKAPFFFGVHYTGLAAIEKCAGRPGVFDSGGRPARGNGRREPPVPPIQRWPAVTDFPGWNDDQSLTLTQKLLKRASARADALCRVAPHRRTARTQRLFKWLARK